jgi:hypothetical protein
MVSVPPLPPKLTRAVTGSIFRLENGKLHLGRTPPPPKKNQTLCILLGTPEAWAENEEENINNFMN